jgi:hypothetical protein
MSPSNQMRLRTRDQRAFRSANDEEVAMLSERFSTAFKAFLGLLPVFYGGIILAVLPATLQWVLTVAVVLITLLVLFAWMGWSLETIWPVFPGVLLIMAGTLALYFGAPTLEPIGSTIDDVLVLYLVGALYIAWAARTTWKAEQIY